ncbi:hypothetical protein F7725_003079 [Dissostichus mawsoni]|uniref:Uncharacterized protein n=1 Tax=Dissostichus mawsoni TaxID=36200 RepID=A0A7J5YAJ0_DISMA|nr:hypothetical protein F7725_003079 [Dissostichus mawsoni]
MVNFSSVTDSAPRLSDRLILFRDYMKDDMRTLTMFLKWALRVPVDQNSPGLQDVQASLRRAPVARQLLPSLPLDELIIQNDGLLLPQQLQCFLVLLCKSKYQLFLPAVMRCRSWGLTLDAEALLILDDEVLLVVLELAQIVLSVLGQQSKLLKSLVDLLVFLRHAVHHPAHWRARLSITKCDLETGTERHGGNGGTRMHPTHIGGLSDEPLLCVEDVFDASDQLQRTANNSPELALYPLGQIMSHLDGEVLTVQRLHLTIQNTMSSQRERL